MTDTDTLIVFFLHYLEQNRNKFNNSYQYTVHLSCMYKVSHHETELCFLYLLLRMSLLLQLKHPGINIPTIVLSKRAVAVLSFPPWKGYLSNALI